MLLAMALNFFSIPDMKFRSPLVFATERCDLLLANGLVFIGDGQPGLEADIAITNGRIVAVNNRLVMDADKTIDCQGLVVSPGFIDLHTHSDDEILEVDTRANSNYLMQGCTTIVTGNCGMGHVDVAKYFNSIDTFGAGTNVAHLLPHGSLRSQVMGKEDREPTTDELREMEALAEKAMLDGAFGMTTGLIYVPGTFAKTGELIAIAKVIAKHDGIYASHIRGKAGRCSRASRKPFLLERRPSYQHTFRISKPRGSSRGVAYIWLRRLSKKRAAKGKK